MNIPSGHFITGDPAFAVDRNGIVVLWNEASEQTFGYTSEEALGGKCWDLLCGHDINGNRYCFENCPLIEMAFLHEPVHAFRSSFDTPANPQKQFTVSCLIVYDNPGDEMLLHICHPEEPGPRPEISAPEQIAASPQANSMAETSRQLAEPLSQREIEVLSLLAAGVGTREVADTLSISIRTVRTHIQHLMYKLHVHKRCAAITKGKLLGLVREVPR